MDVWFWTTILITALFLFQSWFLVVVLNEGRKRSERLRSSLMDAREKLAATESRANSVHDVNDILRGIVDEHREMRRNESQEYIDRAARYEDIIMQKHDRIDELLRQNQNLAERIASLRQEGLSEGGDDFHVEDVEPEKPYSPDLQRFYEGLTSDAQQWAETFIETRRAAGLDDEQILQELDEAGSV